MNKQLSLQGIFAGTGTFTPYQHLHQAAKVSGLLRLIEDEGGSRAEWIGTVTPETEGRQILAAFSLKGSICLPSDAACGEMVLQYENRIGTATASASSSGGSNRYAISDVVREGEKVIKFTASFEAQPTRGDIIFIRQS